MNPITRYIFKVVFVILFQVVALKNLELGIANWWITPFVYFVVILDLPVKFNPIFSMLIALMLGFLIDVFYDTYGMHASACVTLAFLKYYLSIIMLPRDGFDTGSAMTIKNIGGLKYVVFIGVLSICYHLWFFAFEAFTFQSFFLRFSQALVSGLMATILLVFLHYAFNKFEKY